ncbi:MAG: hypothetical protein A2Y88_06065 [Chloroflexi bacterium RBG_13_48_10]|nr:MAG: hypothetical protein A2Y88_06065 [Chloroflexi bacterium RBG_13_48_10]
MITLIFAQIINFLETPQGNLIYSTILSLSSLGVLVAFWYASGYGVSSEAKRVHRGLLCLFLFQVLLLVSTLLAWLGEVETHMFLPLLDRTIALLSLILIIWLWVFSGAKRGLNVFVIFLETLVLIAGIISFVLWLMLGAGLFFNNSTLGAYAYYLGFFLLAVGLLLLLWRRPNDWGAGILMLLIMLAGYLAQYFFPQPAGDYGWLVHIGEMIAFPILFVLPRRFLSNRHGIGSVDLEKSASTTTSILEARLIQSVIDLSSETSPQLYYQKLTRLVAELMYADICLLLMPPKSAGQLTFPVGYHALNDRVIDGFSVDGQKMPLLLNALQTGKALRINGAKAGSEAQTLTSELLLKHNAHLLQVPFHPKGSRTAMGILVLSKSSRPEWSEKDAQGLLEIASALSTSIGQLSRVLGQPSGVEADQQSLQRIRAEYDKLRQEFSQIKAENTRLAAQSARGIGPSGTAAGLLEGQTDLIETIKQLDTRNRELEYLVNKGRPTGEEVEQLRQELRSALADLARIPTTLSKSDQRMLELQLSAVKRLDDMGQTELVTSIAQEFRQPLSSIIGYTDLLLGESTGLLGAVQRKFLERVKASTERLGILMNELVQVMAIDDGKLDQTPTLVELDVVIDEAVGNINAQVSEKNITMHVDLPVKLPAIQANRDALQQILANLLQNACLVTPVDGEIRLSAQIERRENEPHLLLISVSDQGGGISRADMPRVFSRRYKVENPLIQGIGDTGVGLSIVKSLVDLLKGRVWVETQEGIGCTFSVLLPLTMGPTEQISPETIPSN